MKYNKACWWPTFHNWKTSGSFLVWVGTDWWRWNRKHKRPNLNVQLYRCILTVARMSLIQILSRYQIIHHRCRENLAWSSQKMRENKFIFFKWRWRVQWTRVLIKPHIYQQRLVLLIFSIKWDARSSLNDVYLSGLRIWEEALGRWLQKVERQTMWQCIDFLVYLRCYFCFCSLFFLFWIGFKDATYFT